MEANIRLACKISREEYTVYVGINAVRKKYLLEAVEATYYRGIRNIYTGYAGSSTQ